jgi:cysteine desulfurase
MDHIYLDHNATTPTRPEVIDAMARCYTAGYANPASQHQPGQRARHVLEEARTRIAEILGAKIDCPQPDRLVFTSGGTEANNLAILGIARGRGPGPASLVISAIEHASVIEPAEHLMEQGWRLDTLAVDADGVVRLDQLAGMLGPQTRIASVILGNHETGILEPIAEAAAVCNGRDVPLHTDAVAAAGKLPLDFRGLGVAAMSVAAHKFQGPLGIGALILRHGTPLEPILLGGPQQGQSRGGTESVALAVGMQTALELWHTDHEAHAQRLTALRDHFEAGLRAGIPETVIHAASVARLPNTSNVAFPGLDGQILLLALDMAGVACSVGSACASGSSELSPTLRAMGLSNSLVASSLRFSLGATTTETDVDEAVRRILRVCRDLRGDRVK